MARYLKVTVKTAFKDGGEVATDINVIKDFLIGKKNKYRIC
jgi:hypothetical protein